MWIKDGKGRYPLFVAAFHGRVDCVAFLLETALGSASKLEKICAGDAQGDTALHVACLCGRLQCASLLLYYLDDTPNEAGILPSQLARKAGHVYLSQLISNVARKKADAEAQADKKTSSLSVEDIFGCSFSNLSAVMLHYGARWAKLYDAAQDALYFFDRSNGRTQWDRPETWDVSPKDEQQEDVVRDTLRKFYALYNPDKAVDLNQIMQAYKGNYTQLFIQLADRYEVEDLSLFEGVYVES
jgi:hypothetical protein